MSFSNSDKKKVISEFAQGEADTGSVEVQVALLTERIKTLTGHFKSNKKDKHSMRGMQHIIAKRKNLLSYLRGEDYDRYSSLISKLGLRK